ncbi:AGE family epimerase/isomerase [Hallella colorans]|uniref:AGE family epimerase/isomerase n=1 Tax=Hallella colorans TaxID=1703337 RepID=UPI00248F0880|nr:AGE family epimerase/isomerase [Hallella colorans]
MKQEMHDILVSNILPYWLNKVEDHVNGGYFGKVDGHDKVHPTHPKGAILHARALWTFSAAYRSIGSQAYLDAASRCRDYIAKYFIDHKNGGVYWALDHLGQPLDTKKQIYAIAFTIYGLAEYVRATGDEDTLRMAQGLFRDIECRAFDRAGQGYVEALTMDWKPIADMRLSDKDENGARTMNTHLHVIEAYTNLYRVWRAPELRQAIYTLLDIFMHKIVNPTTHHLDLFFDDKWHGKRNIESYGHDIEATWLLHETALLLNDPTTTTQIETLIRQMARAAAEGLAPDGSMRYEREVDSNTIDSQRQWWVQCENIVGHVNLYQHFHDLADLKRAEDCWTYVKNHLIDYENGEWYWSVDEKGNINREEDKAGFWKCPYHNGRMCLEIMERL